MMTLHADGAITATRFSLRRMLTKLCAGLLLAPALFAFGGFMGWSSGPGCNDSGVIEALNKALDNTYAEVRTMAKVLVRIDDIVSVDQSKPQSLCKAMLHVSVNYLEVQKAEQDAVISYTAEVTERGRILVSITTRP